VSKIQAAALEGKPIREIARELGIARNTVRAYLRGGREHPARPHRASKLDVYKDQIRSWVEQDHLVNCETMVERLRTQGYTGGKTLVKDFVHPLRPAKRGQAPVIRYETPPGQHLQVDWGEFVYEQDGARRKVYGLATVLGYSRLRFVVFLRRCDAPSLIRGLLAAWTYCGGVPEMVLTDRMKTVLLSMDGPTPHWHPLFADFLATVGVVPRVCKAYTPQTKGKVERAVGVIKSDFWPGVTFTDLDDLNRQASAWCDRRNRRVNRTTHVRPLDRLADEGLRPLLAATLTARFVTEDRQVSWDGFVSYDGTLYGLPAQAAVAGSTVQVRAEAGELHVSQSGHALATLPLCPRTGEQQIHPDQWTGVSPATALRRRPVSLGHLVGSVSVAQRPLAQYDQLCGVSA
jgi:transposase